MTADHQGAASVTVRLMGAGKATSTAESGDFVFRGLTAGTDTLEISLVGYSTLKQPVTIIRGGTLNVALQLSVSDQQLQEVIIAGAAHPFTRRSSDDLAKMPLANLENAQVYSTVTRDLMTEQSAFSVDQALSNVPGITKLWDATGRAGAHRGMVNPDLCAAALVRIGALVAQALEQGKQGPEL